MHPSPREQEVHEADEEHQEVDEEHHEDGEVLVTVADEAVREASAVAVEVSVVVGEAVVSREEEEEVSAEEAVVVAVEGLVDAVEASKMLVESFHSYDGTKDVFSKSWIYGLEAPSSDTMIILSAFRWLDGVYVTDVCILLWLAKKPQKILKTFHCTHHWGYRGLGHATLAFLERIQIF